MNRTDNARFSGFCIFAFAILLGSCEQNPNFYSEEAIDLRYQINFVSLKDQLPLEDAVIKDCGLSQLNISGDSIWILPNRSLELKDLILRSMLVQCRLSERNIDSKSKLEISIFANPLAMTDYEKIVERPEKHVNPAIPNLQIRIKIDGSEIFNDRSVNNLSAELEERQEWSKLILKATSQAAANLKSLRPLGRPNQIYSRFCNSRNNFDKIMLKDSEIIGYPNAVRAMPLTGQWNCTSGSLPICTIQSDISIFEVDHGIGQIIETTNESKWILPLAYVNGDNRSSIWNLQENEPTLARNRIDEVVSCLDSGQKALGNFSGQNHTFQAENQVNCIHEHNPTVTLFEMSEINECDTHNGMCELKISTEEINDNGGIYTISRIEIQSNFFFGMKSKSCVTNIARSS